MNSKKTREKVGLLLTGTRELVTNDLEKSKMLNAAFVSVYTSKNGFQESQAPAARVKVWCKEDFYSGEESHVREH